MGQRRLIFHIAQALNSVEDTSGQTGSAASVTSATVGDTGVPITSSGTGTGSATTPATTAGNIGVSLATNQASSQAAVHHLASMRQQQTTQDIYSLALLSSLLGQQAQLATAGQSTACVNDSVQRTVTGSTQQVPQPSWSDPQVHIASATGKFTSVFYDICDFVPHALEEDVLIGGQGEQQLVIKAGPKKPRLESLTLSQWSVANLAILYKLVNEGKLVGPSMKDYLSYSTKVYQLVQRFSLVSVLLYDREYRKLQSTMGFRWGTDVQHLHTLFLQPRAGSGVQRNSANVQKKGYNHSSKPKVDKRIEICRNFNSERGCSYAQCRFQHKCIIPGCNQGHPATAHSQEKM